MAWEFSILGAFASGKQPPPSSDESLTGTSNWS